MKKRLLFLWSLILFITTLQAQNINRAEYFFDADPGAGNGIAITIAIPADIVNFTATISTASLPAGFHILGLRVKDANGQWGLFEKRGFYISTTTVDAANIVAAEYFLDADPGIGNATALSVGTTGAVVNFTAVIPTSLPAGFHFLSIRTKGADGIWGHFEKRGFYISGATADAANIVAAEYFFDTDPGVGNGTATSVGTTGAAVNFTAVIPTSLSPGFHFLAIRTKGADGIWGLYDKRGFFISASTVDASNIVAAEYFFDTDPGHGNGTATSVGTTGAVVNFTVVIPTSLSAGFHFLAIRTKGADGIWGLYDKRGFYISAAALDAANIVAAEYFFDTDPGVGNGTLTSVGTTGAVVNFTATIPTSLLAGFHFLAIRTKGADGIWGLFEKRGFYVSTAASDVAIIVAAEYFFDTDPGVGNATPLTVTTPGNIVTQTFLIPDPGLTLGSHNLSIRVKGQDGKWGLYEYRSFNIGNSTIACPANTTVSTAIGQCSAVVNSIDPTVNPVQSHTYSLTGATTASGIGTASGLTFNAGVTTVAYVLTGSPTINCSFTVTVNAVAPAITTQPATQTICAGANVTFSVVATGTGLTYQWRKGGVNIPAATSASFSITAVVAGDAGNYDVVVTSPCSLSVTSSIAVLTVGVTSITTHPISQAVCPGTNVSFSVVAAGTGLTYQWRKGGINIPGATVATFTITGVVAGNAGNYDVVVTGSCGNATSNIAILTVNAVTVISTNPGTQTVCAGTNISFSVVANGTGVLTYQWRKASVNIPGATSATYSITGVAAVDAGSYDVVVTGTCGSATSSAAVLTVNAVTLITVQPANQASCLGGSVTFSVVATGTNLTYQWKKNTVDIPGATSSNFTLNPVTAGDAASYTVAVVGTCGSIISNAATLTITAGTIINTQPANQSSCLGGSVTFSVSASGSGTLTYQWKKNTIDIPGATAASFTINPVVAADAANYTVVVNSSCGSTTSNIATLTILPATGIATQPSNQIVCTGSNATFSVVANGNNLTYQWRKAAVNIPGANAASFTITAVTAGDVGNYDVVITGTCGVVTSVSVSLTLGNIVISSQPVSQTVCAGTNVSFSVGATGTALTYQWRKATVNIAGATSATFTITGVVAGDAGSYDVVITGTCTPAITSSTATLTVNSSPLITTQPTGGTVCTGSNFTFTVVATGTALTYQWRKGTVNIPGAISSSYTITNVIAGDAGNYDVIVSGTCAPISTSNVAVLNVNVAPAITSQPTSQSTCTGSNVTFSVTASGAGLTFQWRKGTVNISGATASIYTISGVVAGDAGSYDVVISGTCSPAVTSNAVVLTINNTLVITTQPQSQTVCAGTNVNFSIVATGSGLSYQWRKNTINITGATTSTFSITGITASDAGNYDVIVGSTCSSSITSGTATLSINALPQISTQPLSQTVCTGTNVSFSVTATGTGLSYQWRKNSINIPGATAANFSITGVTAGDAGNYDVVVSGSCSPAVISNIATLAIGGLPITITSQPANASGCAGVSKSFSVIVSTPSTTNYQWQISTDGGITFTNITGATSAILNISAISLAMNNNKYRVVLTGGCPPPTTSAAATLTVNPQASIVFGALSAKICLSDTLVILSASPAGGTWSGTGISGNNFIPPPPAGNYTLTYNFTNTGGCISNASLVAKVETCPERTRFLWGDGILLYPNPNNGKFFLKINSDLYTQINMKIFANNGTQIAYRIISGIRFGREIPINITHLAAGIYHVKIYSEDPVGKAQKTFHIIIGKH